MIVALVGTLALIVQAQADPSPPVFRWSLQAEPARCVLEGQDAQLGATVSIYTTPGSDTYGVALAGQNVKGAASSGPASLTFAPSQKIMKGFARTAKLPDGTPVVSMKGLSPALLDDLASAETVTIATGSDVRNTLPVTNTAKAVEALRRCSADQLVEWGADAVQFAPGGKGPVALVKRDDWVANSKLLAIARQSKRSVIDDDFRVTVSADGTISDCRAMTSMTEAGTEKIACSAVLNKHLFAPATNATGTPVRGVATFRVMLVSRPR